MQHKDVPQFKVNEPAFMYKKQCTMHHIYKFQGLVLLTLTHCMGYHVSQPSQHIHILSKSSLHIRHLTLSSQICVVIQQMNEEDDYFFLFLFFFLFLLPFWLLLFSPTFLLTFCASVSAFWLSLSFSSSRTVSSVIQTALLLKPVFFFHFC